MQHDAVTTVGRHGGLLLIVATALAGVLVLVVALTGQESEPPAAPESVGTIEGPSARPSTPGSAPPDVEPAAEVPLPASPPVSIRIPRIDVRSKVFAIGKAPDGTLAVPQPGPNLDKAAWFEDSPTPGRPGPSVIEGHVATAENGPSVFFELGRLRPGDEVEVTRADGIVVVFTVDGLRTFAKDEFPTAAVYGGNLSDPTLRLITCSDFDPRSGDHTGNLVVFTSLTDVRDR